LSGLAIRESGPEDWAAIEDLYPAAFPDEDLLPLVATLFEAPETLSLVAQAGVALAGDRITGHVLFTRCGIDGAPDAVALLGPLAVAPKAQGQGVGSALVRAGLARLEAEGVVRVFVLGDPDYYGRFGFAPDADVATPYPIPEEWRAAWQSLGLGGAAALKGRLSVPAPWRDPALWAE
jgi:putative acetyltransferase